MVLVSHTQGRWFDPHYQLFFFSSPSILLQSLPFTFDTFDYTTHFDWKIVIFIATWKQSLICLTVLLWLQHNKHGTKYLYNNNQKYINSINQFQAEHSKTLLPSLWWKDDTTSEKKRINSNRMTLYSKRRMCCVQFLEMECSTHQHQNTNTHCLSQW